MNIGKVKTLEDVALLIEALGIGTDEPVAGTDAVEFLSALLTELRS